MQYTLKMSYNMLDGECKLVFFKQFFCSIIYLIFNLILKNLRITKKKKKMNGVNKNNVNKKSVKIE